jgi:hypothetical protein
MSDWATQLFDGLGFAVTQRKVLLRIIVDSRERSNRAVEKTACYRHASYFVPRVIEEDGWDM